MIGGKRNGFGDVRDIAVAIFVQHAQRHDGRFRRHADHAEAIVRGLRNRSGDVRAMRVFIIRVFVVVNEIIPLDKRRLRQIRHAMIFPLLVAVIFERDAGINHRHDRALAFCAPPSVFNLDHLHVPLFVIHRIIRLAVGFVKIVRLGVFDKLIVGQLLHELDERVGGFPLWNGKAHQRFLLGKLAVIRQRNAVHIGNFLDGLRRRLIFEIHDNFGILIGGGLCLRHSARAEGKDEPCGQKNFFHNHTLVSGCRKYLSRFSKEDAHAATSETLFHH